MNKDMSREDKSGSAGQKITPFLWFDKECEEAMNYYVSVFNGNPNKKHESKIIDLKRYPTEPVPGLPSQGLEGKVLTGVFELEGQKFMALDGGPVFQMSGAISLLVEVSDQEELDYFWAKLSAVPEAEQCGWCRDKFGVTWQIVPKGMDRWIADSDKERSNRAMQAMLKMKKIVIADLEKAYNS